LRKGLSKKIPDDNVWDQINVGLEHFNSLGKLPHHSPNEKVWFNIENNLNKTKPFSFPTFLRVAASILVLIGIGFIINQILLQKNQKVNITYSEVWIDPIDTEKWNLNEDIEINHLIEKNEIDRPLLLKSPEYLMLKQEYSSLLSSKKTILNELNSFSDESSIELILTKIELEKNEYARNLILFSLI
jgi:hypothetical protein